MAVRKSLCIKISSAIIFHCRELNLVSKCRQINKIPCGKKNRWGVSLEKKNQNPSLVCLAKNGKFHTFTYISRDR